MSKKGCAIILVIKTWLDERRRASCKTRNTACSDDTDDKEFVYLFGGKKNEERQKRDGRINEKKWMSMSKKSPMSCVAALGLVEEDLLRVVVVAEKQMSIENACWCRHVNFCMFVHSSTHQSTEHRLQNTAAPAASLLSPELGCRS